MKEWKTAFCDGVAGVLFAALERDGTEFRQNFVCEFEKFQILFCDHVENQIQFLNKVIDKDIQKNGLGQKVERLVCKSFNNIMLKVFI